MGIHFACPCGRTFSVRKRHAGKSLACPDCGEPLTVPPPLEVSAHRLRKQSRSTRAYHEAETTGADPEEEMLGGLSREDLLAPEAAPADVAERQTRKGLTPTDSDPGFDDIDDDMIGGVAIEDLLGDEPGPVFDPPEEASVRLARHHRARRQARERHRTPPAAEQEPPRQRKPRRFRRLAVMLLLLAGLIVAFPMSVRKARRALNGQESAARAVAHNDRGVELDAAHRLPEAIAEFQEAIRLAPDLFEAHYNLGNTLDAARRYEESLASFQVATQLRPDHAGAQFGLGAALVNTGQYTSAERALRGALLLDPEHAEAHHYLARALYGLGQYQAALEELREAHRLGAHIHAEFARQIKAAAERQVE